MKIEYRALQEEKFFDQIAERMAVAFASRQLPGSDNPSAIADFATAVAEFAVRMRRNALTRLHPVDTDALRMPTPTEEAPAQDQDKTAVLAPFPSNELGSGATLPEPEPEEELGA